MVGNFNCFCLFGRAGRSILFSRPASANGRIQRFQFTHSSLKHGFFIKIKTRQQVDGFGEIKIGWFIVKIGII
jgi:hypothetical protein